MVIDLISKMWSRSRELGSKISDCSFSILQLALVRVEPLLFSFYPAGIRIIPGLEL